MAFLRRIDFYIEKSIGGGTGHTRVKKQGYFHRWFYDNQVDENNKSVRELLGLVEDKEGNMDYIDPHDIIFTGSVGDPDSDRKANEPGI